MKHFMLRVDRGRMLFERLEMRFELFEIFLVTDRTELRAMELLELLYQFGMRCSEFLLRRGELIGGRLGLLGHTEASYSATEASVSQNPGHRRTGRRGYF